eukprot:scaffold199932_cov21-Tisochrysis_lutea.AAC.1
MCETCLPSATARLFNGPFHTKPCNELSKWPQQPVCLTTEASLADSFPGFVEPVSLLVRINGQVVMGDYPEHRQRKEKKRKKSA